MLLLGLLLPLLVGPLLSCEVLLSEGAPKGWFLGHLSCDLLLLMLLLLLLLLGQASPAGHSKVLKVAGLLLMLLLLLLLRLGGLLLHRRGKL